MKNLDTILKEMKHPTVRVITDVEEYKRVRDYNQSQILSKGFDANLIAYKLKGEALEFKKFLEALNEA